MFDGQSIYSEWEGGEVCRGYWWANQKESDNWEDQDVDGRIILRWILEKGIGVI
jgi:hypothetical protein